MDFPPIQQDRLKASFRFAGALALWALAALAAILLLTAYTIRLDIAYMEVNGMLKNELLREAIFQEAFELDFWLYLAFPLGLLANGVIALLFGRTQDRFFKSFAQSISRFEKEGELPGRKVDLGPLDRYTRDFLFILKSKLDPAQPASSEKGPGLELLASWPNAPRIYWKDQLKFGLLSGVLACYFSSLCMVIFWQVNGRIIDLARQLTTARHPEMPQFFLTQMGMAEPIGWSVVVGVTAMSMLSGMRFASTTSNTAYACGRQLKRFLGGDYRARIFLRAGDPGREDVLQVNEILGRLEARLEAVSSARSP